MGFIPLVDVEIGAGKGAVVFDEVSTGFKAGLAAPESGGETAAASLVTSPSPMTFFFIKPMIPMLSPGAAVVEVVSSPAFSRVGSIISCAVRKTVSIA